jgi:hypothetical protein
MKGGLNDMIEINGIFPFFTCQDLYSFDENLDKAVQTYEEICEVYTRLFQRLNLPHIKGELFEPLFIHG